MNTLIILPSRNFSLSISFLSRMFPQACDQQRSDCSNSPHHFPPAPPLPNLLAFLLLTIGQHRSPLQWGGGMHYLDMADGYHGNTVSRNCGNRPFMISPNEIASNTSLPCERDRKGAENVTLFTACVSEIGCM